MPVNNSLTRADAPEIMSWVVHGSTYEEISVSSGQTYVAPATGWVVFEGRASAPGNHIRLQNGVITSCSANMSGVNYKKIASYIPVAKGGGVLVEFSDISSTDRFRFYYCRGDE